MNSMTLNKIAAAVLLAGVVAMTTGFVTRLIHPAAGGGHHGEAHGDEKRILAQYVKEASAEGPADEGPAGPEPIAGLLATADIAAGEAYFKKRCTACHTIEKGGAKKTGPALYGIMGDDIAARDFKYSDVLTGLPGNWTYAEMNAFLHKPKAYAPKTRMSFPGIRKTETRAAVIAYLRAQDDTPEPLPGQ